MIIKEMFYIPIKLKPKLARASMTTSDVNKQWRIIFQQQSVVDPVLSLCPFSFLMLHCLFFDVLLLIISLVSTTIFYTPVSRRTVLCDWVWRGGGPTGFFTKNLFLFI
jgi:hypothetical protein